MSIKLAFDPSILWMIDDKNLPTAGEAIQLIQQSTEVLKKARDEELEIYFYLGALDCLAKINYYPAGFHFDHVLKCVGLANVINSADLASLVTDFLSRAILLEDKSDLSFCLWEEYSIEPPVFEVIRSETLRTISEESALFTAAVNLLSERHIDQASYAYCLTGGGSRSVCVSGKLLPDPASLGSIFAAGVNTCILMICAISQAHVSLDPGKLWSEARETWELELALRIGCLQANGGQLGPSVEKFRCGGSFLESLDSVGALKSGPFCSITYRKCIDVLLARVKLVEFRMSAASTSPGRTRSVDGARAKRVHLTRAHEGLRLMLWVCPDGTIEFANVGVKKELLIEE